MIVFDASSLFNLHNGALFPSILLLPNGPITLGPQVLRECRSIETALQKLRSEGQADFLSDDELSFGRYMDLLTCYKLGPGETECVVIAETTGCRICCDDLKARRMIAAELGDARLTGTLGLLREAVAAGVIDEEQARTAYATMIARGAFLPEFNLASPEAVASPGST